ncbi:uncharacterized protein EV420DRAFT_1570466 [Desarmillaria tabescens]|uniref:Uncharacterized protein n=1 Tax=Armillaria tabescens TaxID=1929756 RepID=A0AA39MUE0_ARMTA|nr:uncharacterized protein EV420DRAFT_1570466 [Desarmillaria tabescens]KAK0446404.1 hypothetical protein EV420DRAFT_1570466 [Desarmillaria tabescens]
MGSRAVFFLTAYLRSPLLTQDHVHCRLRCQSRPLKCTDDTKYLGIVFCSTAMDISKEHSVEVVKIQEGTACLRWRGIWGISTLAIYSAWVDSLLTYGSQVVVVTTLRQLERVQILWLSGNRCWLTDITTALQRLNYPIHATLEELYDTDFVTMLSSRCGRPRFVDDPTTSLLVQVFSRSVPVSPRHSYYGTPYCDDPGFDLNSSVDREFQ